MKLCMGCMTNIADNCTTCPHCGYDETTLRQESVLSRPGNCSGWKIYCGTCYLLWWIYGYLFGNGC